MIKYLYLDDQNEDSIKDIAELLSAEVEGLEVKFSTPKSFGEEIKRLKNEKIDGLILDLRLDEKSEAEYRAFTLAQEIRTRATEGSMIDIPIVVCSTDPKLKKSYNKDFTGHDLFDKKYLKKEELVDKSEKVACELKALAEGYKRIAEIRSKIGGKGVQLKRFFLLDESQLELLDERLLDFFGEISGRLPVHEYARFILNDLIFKSGPLVDRNTLAARLGVNVDTAEFEKLIVQFLNTMSYTGPFGTYWKRWWWPLIEKWWIEQVKATRGLAGCNADERVNFLKKFTKLNLECASPISEKYSKKFWTICKYYQKPLDPFDGVLIEMKRDPYVWQDNEYMSIKAALNIDSKVHGIFPHSLEKERVNDLKKGKNE